MTKQRRWQITQIAAGKCSTCGLQRNLYATQCDDCGEKTLNRRRIRNGVRRPKSTYTTGRKRRVASRG